METMRKPLRSVFLATILCGCVASSPEQEVALPIVGAFSQMTGEHARLPHILGWQCDVSDLGPLIHSRNGYRMYAKKIQDGSSEEEDVYKVSVQPPNWPCAHQSIGYLRTKNTQGPLFEVVFLLTVPGFPPVLSSMASASLSELESAKRKIQECKEVSEHNTNCVYVVSNSYKGEGVSYFIREPGKSLDDFSGIGVVMRNNEIVIGDR